MFNTFFSNLYRNVGPLSNIVLIRNRTVLSNVDDNVQVKIENEDRKKFVLRYYENLRNVCDILNVNVSTYTIHHI